jgi:hypothetical protein
MNDPVANQEYTSDVPAEYDARKTAAKGAVGAADGVVAAIVVGLVTTAINRYLSDMPSETRTYLAGSIGAAAAAAVVGIRRGVSNWWKHRKAAR